MSSTRPNATELDAARNGQLADLIAMDLNVIFCGINPGLYSAAVGHHFARPGNRFWPALFRSGFTPRLFAPSEGSELLRLGYGLTNIVNRATAAASELSREELVEGGQFLKDKLRRYRPQVVAFAGIGAYRQAFDRRKAHLGLQDELLGETRIWVLPSPSGLNAHFSSDDLAACFRELYDFAAASRPTFGSLPQVPE